jgi:hypothetical protein
MKQHNHRFHKIEYVLSYDDPMVFMISPDDKVFNKLADAKQQVLLLKKIYKLSDKFWYKIKRVMK